jgi:hypothetical protein
VPAAAVKLAVVTPALTVTLDGTVTAPLLLDRLTAAPPEGATFVKVTVQFEDPPLATVDGLQAIPPTCSNEVTVTDDVCEVPLYVAVRVAVWSAVTVPAAAAKLAVLTPALTVTLDGTVTAPLLLDRLTAAPPEGATFDKVTVQFDVAPLATAEGLQLSEVTCTGALTVREVVCEVPLYVAVSVAVWSVVTVPAAAVKLAVVKPAPTVTLAGTVTAPLLLESVTAAPPDGAAFVKVTVQIEDPPPATVDGLQAIPPTCSSEVTVTDDVCEVPL